MADHSFDVVIIGGGNGGMGVTVPTRHAGKKVALLEPAELGGTCSNRGCTPKKVLVAAAHALDGIARAGAHHISVGPATLDWAALIDREKQMIEPIPGALAAAMEKRGVHLVRAHGHFVSRNAVKAGGQIYEAENIVIATGSRPRPLAVSRRRADDHLRRGAERAHAAARRGLRRRRRHRLRVRPRLCPRRHQGDDPATRAGGFLPRHDADAVDQMLDEHAPPRHRRARLDRGEGDRGGRRPPARDLRARTAASTRSRPTGWSTPPGASPTPRGSISPPARCDASTAACCTTTICARPRTRRCGSSATRSPTRRSSRRWRPTRAACRPATSSRGRNTGPTIRPSPSASSRCRRWPASASPRRTPATAASTCTSRSATCATGCRAAPIAEAVAWAKVISERSSGRILGAHIVGHRGEDLIHVFALAMRHGITTADIRRHGLRLPDLRLRHPLHGVSARIAGRGGGRSM